MLITELSIKRPAFSWVLSLILVLFGSFVFWKLPVRELPSGLQPPVVQVNVEYSSASSQIVDEEVTQVIEDVIGGAEGIKNIEKHESQKYITYDGRGFVLWVGSAHFSLRKLNFYTGNNRDQTVRSESLSRRTLMS